MAAYVKFNRHNESGLLVLLAEHRTNARMLAGSSHREANIRGLQISDWQALPLSFHLQMMSLSPPLRYP